MESYARRVHLVLVRPENPNNVGAAARAAANMGIKGDFWIVGSPGALAPDAYRMAKHARDRLDRARRAATLAEVFGTTRKLALASTARSGSPGRPHPIGVAEAVERSIGKLTGAEIEDLFFVFGPESDGLNNAEVAACDWVVTIPSNEEYRSLNLAQSTLIFCYEAQRILYRPTFAPVVAEPSQKGRLIEHALQMAEEVGFVHPGDPHKMRPRLEEILSHLPPHVWGVKTLHGLLNQIIRSVRRGEPDFKGRFRGAKEETLGA